MSGVPSTRASNAKDYLLFLERSYPKVGEHLRANVPAEVMRRIEEGLRTDWIPIALDGQYVDAVLAFMGPDVMRAASRKFLVESLTKSPTMRSLFEGVVNVFGVSVGGLLRIFPAAFQQSYRDAFTLKLERGDREALAAFSDVAPEVLEFGAYVVIWEGLFLGIYDLARTPPQLELTVLKAQRRVEVRFKW